MSTPEKICKFFVNAVGFVISLALLALVIGAPVYIFFHFLVKYW